MVSNPETVAGVLRDRPETFRRTTRLEQISREFGFLGLFSASGDTWKRQRPMVLAGRMALTMFPVGLELRLRLRSAVN